MIIQNQQKQDCSTPFDEASNEDICSNLEYHLAKQQSLCQKLELVADDLPEHIDTQTCLQLSKDIMPVVNNAHQFEESTLFPVLLEQNAQDKKLKSILERLRYEHWEDEGFGEEVSEGLKEFGLGRPYSAEKLGYMLRGFFEGLRRHIAFENEILLPMLKS